MSVSVSAVHDSLESGGASRGFRNIFCLHENIFAEIEMSRLTFCILFVAVFSSIEAHSGKSSLETTHENVIMRKRMLIIFRIPKIPEQK